MRIILVGVFIFVFFPVNAFAVSKAKDVKAGSKLYQDGKYDASLEKFNEALKKDPDSDVINFNVGTAFYKKGNYEKTVEHLNKSLLSPDKKLEGWAHYNLGNTLYKYGLTKEKKDLQAAVNLLEQALPHYKKTLALDSKDADAKYNHDFVQKELERLRKKLQEQKQNQSAQQNSPQNQKGEEQKTSQDNTQESKSKELQSNQAKSSDGQEKNKPQESLQTDQQNEKSQDNESAAKKQDEHQENKDSQATQAQKEDLEKKGGTDLTQAQDQPTTLNPQELTKKEAQRILDDYSQEEEPKGLLHLNKESKGDVDVQKDW